ncbi:MAG: hypothetical protein ABIV51_04200 [Saprospiraceae bacterium]
MEKLFNNKYRIPSARLRDWDYAREAMYYVTISSKYMANYFGEIENSILQPTQIGKIAHSEWYRTIQLRIDMNIELGEFVVMPNHIHGIIIIGANDFNSPDPNMNNPFNVADAVPCRDATHCRDAKHGVSTRKNQFAPQSKNLAAIIRGYKSAVTTYARKNAIDFDWHARFYDHIIRSESDYRRISKYILNNPAAWQSDKFHLE